MSTRPQYISQTIQVNLDKLKAEQHPITPEDQRCVERMQNLKLATQQVEIDLLREGIRLLRLEIAELKNEKGSRSWPINFPAFPYRTIGDKPYRRTHWEGCQAVHSECGEPFKQADLLDEPEPEYPERDGRGDPECDGCGVPHKEMRYFEAFPSPVLLCKSCADVSANLEWEEGKCLGNP